MENDVFHKLVLLKEKQKKDSLEKDISKMLNLVEQISATEGKVKENYIFLKLVASSLKCFISDEIRKTRVKRELKQVLNCEDDDIVYDENDISNNNKATVIAGSINYSASLNKKYLENKRIIWGDLDIRALEDISCLRNVELIGGDLLVCDDVELPNLKYVLGNIKRLKIKVSRLNSYN